MAEGFPQNKILKYLILVILITSLVILIKGVILKPKELVIPGVSLPIPQAKIDFEILSDPKVEELLPFEEISRPEEIGRENPFLPY